MSPLKKSLFDFLIPGGFIFAAAFALFRLHGLPQWVEGPIQVFPLIILAFGFFFGWYLSSSRLILSLVVLALADRAVVLYSPADPESSGAIFFSCATLLVPLNLMAFSLIKEEAIATWRGMSRLLVVLLQPFLVFWLARPGQAWVAYSLQQPLAQIVNTDWVAIPQVAIVTYVGALLLIGTRFIVGRNLLDSGTLWTLIASFLAFQGVQSGWSPTSFFSTAGLIFFVALVQASHRQSYCDEVTGVPGKLAYDEAVSGLGTQYVLAVVGIDQLKHYGNQRGKSVSEQVLRLLAQKIMTAAGSGRVYRLAGEEFLILFPRKTATATLVDLGVVRKAVEETDLYVSRRGRVWEGDGGVRKNSGNERLPATVSIGLAEADDATLSLAVVTKAAYRALYEAKGEGGNRVKRGTVSTENPKSRSASAGPLMAYSDLQP